MDNETREEIARLSATEGSGGSMRVTLHEVLLTVPEGYWTRPNADAELNDGRKLWEANCDAWGEALARTLKKTVGEYRNRTNG